MDASRFKRRSTQTFRQPTKINPEDLNKALSPQVDICRPIAVPVRRATPTLLPLAKNISVNSDLNRTKTIGGDVRPRPMVRNTLAAEVVQSPVAAAAQSVIPTVASTASLPIDMVLPGGVSNIEPARTSLGRGRWYSMRKWVLRGAIASLVLIISVSGVLFSQGAFKLHKVFHGGTTTAAALKQNVNPDLLKGEGDGRVNVLLLGRGGGNHDGPDLTDTMILASIDPVNHTQSLLSIPRDLWVKVPNAGSMKINAAWETGEFKYLGKIRPGSTDPKAIQAGFDLADQTVESVIGLPINYNVIVDFDAFQQAVTTVGGVTVNVPTDLVDGTMAWQNNNSPVLAKAGLDTFNGGQALNYVRSRETTSDFARSQRQRAVMLALKNKLKTLGTLSNPLKISQLISDFGNNVSTDFSLSNASRLYDITKDIGDTSTASIGLADKPNDFVTTAMINGQSIDQPTAGLNNYKAIQSFVHSQLQDGYILKEKAKVMVYNGTAEPGIATAAASMLKSYGYNVIGTANTPSTGWTQTTLVSLNNNSYKYTQNYLEQRYKVTAATRMPDPAIATNGADFVIIVGSDEATSTSSAN
jgi:LCP family protein required for cell wall assembly